MRDDMTNRIYQLMKYRTEYNEMTKYIESNNDQLNEDDKCERRPVKWYRWYMKISWRRPIMNMKEKYMTKWIWGEDERWTNIIGEAERRQWNINGIWPRSIDEAYQ